MPDYRSRLLDAPAREWLDAEQAADFLGLRSTEFLERVALGVFPPGSASNLRDSQWHWTVVLSLSYLRPWLDAEFTERKKSRRKNKKELPGAPAQDSAKD